MTGADIPLVLDAAVAVLPQEAAEQVRVVEAARLPIICWPPP